MDLACGTGILCRLLQSSGIRAAGMDLSDGMIAIARQTSPDIPYTVADMVTFRPEETYDLVTCTGDALNHIESLEDVARIFHNVYSFLNPGGCFVFDLLNENEISTGEPFETDYDDTARIRFQMTRPEHRKVALSIQVWEGEVLRIDEIIRETLHSPDVICDLLQREGFRILCCGDRLLEDSNPGTTWFLAVQKP